MNVIAHKLLFDRHCRAPCVTSVPQPLMSLLLSVNVTVVLVAVAAVVAAVVAALVAAAAVAVIRYLNGRSGMASESAAAIIFVALPFTVNLIVIMIIMRGQLQVRYHTCV